MTDSEKVETVDESSTDNLGEISTEDALQALLQEIDELKKQNSELEEKLAKVESDKVSQSERIKNIILQRKTNSSKIQEIEEKEQKQNNPRQLPDDYFTKDLSSYWKK